MSCEGVRKFQLIHVDRAGRKRPLRCLVPSLLLLKNLVNINYRKFMRLKVGRVGEWREFMK